MALLLIDTVEATLGSGISFVVSQRLAESHIGELTYHIRSVRAEVSDAAAGIDREGIPRRVDTATKAHRGASSGTLRLASGRLAVAARPVVPSALSSRAALLNLRP